jgi:hypothetical protein
MDPVDQAVVTALEREFGNFEQAVLYLFSLLDDKTYENLLSRLVDEGYLAEDFYKVPE